MHSLKWRLPSRPFWHLDKMHSECSTNHGMKGDLSPSGSCVHLSKWHLIVLVIPRSSIIAFSMSPFDSLSPFTASSVATSALHNAATRYLNAIIASCVSLFNVISRYPNRSINCATLSTAHGSLTRFFWDRLGTRTGLHFHEENNPWQ